MWLLHFHNWGSITGGYGSYRACNGCPRIERLLLNLKKKAGLWNLVFDWPYSERALIYCRSQYHQDRRSWSYAR